MVVKAVPAQICENCGEPFFSPDVTDRLLELARQAAEAGVIVDVRTYVAA